MKVRFQRAAGVLATCVLFFGLTAACRAGDPAPAGALSIVPGEVLLRMKAGLPNAGRTTLSPLARLAATHAVETLLPTNARLESEAADHLSRTFRLRLNPGEDVDEVIRNLSADPDVEYAGPIRLIPLAAGPAFQPDDPQLAAQWHHERIGSFVAWDRSAGDPAVPVAVIDTGLQMDHPDLAPNLWVNALEAAGEPGVDDDANGYVDDVNGFDFTDVPEILGSGDFKDRDPDPSDDVGHGTWVAGAACAAGDNGIGVAGVAFRSRIMPLRAGFRPRSGFSLGFLAEDDAAAAIVYAVDNGARVLNLSFGDVVHAPILDDAVRYALDRGAVVVAAAGNEGNSQPFYPAGVSGVLAVGASDRDGRRASFSTFGPAVTLLAPGASLFTTDLAGGYGPKSGTSLASPVVAGAAALLLAIHPDWTADQIVARLRNTAEVPGAAADARGARRLRIDLAAGAEGSAGGPAEARFLGLDDDDTVDGTVRLVGRAAGTGVRGWRVSLRRGPAESWRTLFADPASPALDAVLGDWETSAEPEGPAFLRLEALGFDAPVASSEARIRIDHSAPVVDRIAAIPILSGDGYGLRVEAETDDPTRGSAILDVPGGRLETRSVFYADQQILGFDGPIPRLGTAEDLVLGFENAAGLKTEIRFPFTLPEPPVARPVATLEPSPGVRTWMPRILDLNQNGRPDLIAETQPRGGRIYGEVLAFEPSTLIECPTCPVAPLAAVWSSGQEYIPQDVADLNGDGRPEILGLAFQELRVYDTLPAGGYPVRLRWQTGEAWGSRFIPSFAGSGFDIVATRDTEVRLYGIENDNLVLRQTLSNPTAGGNSISPGVALGYLDGDDRPSLVTLDGDGDLLIWTRSAEGSWAVRPPVRLAGAYVTSFAAADLDGDGRDEIAIVEAVGTIPSPAGGLRDGFYRLNVFRFTPGAGLEPWLKLGAAGFFPGNPVSLDGADFDGDGKDELWWGVRSELYRVELVGGSLRGTGHWDGLTVGRPAAGELSKEGRDVSVLYFPGVASGDTSRFDPVRGRVLAARADLAPSSAITGLRVFTAERDGSHVAVELEWNAAGTTYSVRRADPGQTPHLVYQGSEPRFPDTLIPGFTYTYEVFSAAPIEPARIVVTARPENPVTETRITGSDIVITWEYPVRATEHSRIQVDPGTVTSALFDRDGRRLRISLAEPIEPGGACHVELTDYFSATNLPLKTPDNAVDVRAPEATAYLSLRSVRPADERTLILTFSPAAPAEISPDLVAVEPGITVLSVERLSDEAISIGLDPATALRSGRFTVRLLPGLTGPSGEPLRAGFGDSLPFQLDPMVYPNPARPGHDAVRFDWLSEGAVVSVFDLNGRSVWQGTADDRGRLLWNLVTASGQPASPGAYLYQVDGRFPARGKLAILK